jgi:hypothetical protein
VTQKLLIGASGGQAQCFLPGALGGGAPAETEVEFADNGVPAAVAAQARDAAGSIRGTMQNVNILSGISTACGHLKPLWSRN